MENQIKELKDMLNKNYDLLARMREQIDRIAERVGVPQELPGVKKYEFQEFKDNAEGA